MGKLNICCCELCGKTEESNEFWATVEFRSCQYDHNDGTSDQNYSWTLCRTCKVKLLDFMLEPAEKREKESQMPDKLQEYAKKIRKEGPTRVVVDREGSATMRRAREEHGVEPDIIFIRNDGWSLGAPKQFAEVAESLWAGEWIGVLKHSSEVPEPYEANVAMRL